MLAWLALLIASAGAEAHPGGLDATGCHRNKHERMVRHCHASNSVKQNVQGSIRPSKSRQIVGTTSVVDGDTLQIRGVRIRLHGIDAPESRQTCVDQSGRGWRCGQQAALRLQEKVGRSSVSCERRDTDRYGRIVAVCQIGELDLNRWLVSEGWAVAYRRYSSDYVGEEAAAKSRRQNIWSGHFDLPWVWRSARRGR